MFATCYDVWTLTAAKHACLVSLLCATPACMLSVLEVLVRSAEHDEVRRALAMTLNRHVVKLPGSLGAVGCTYVCVQMLDDAVL